MQDEVRYEKDQPETGSLDQFFADQEIASPTQSIAAEPEAEMQEAGLKSADPTQSLEAEIESEMQADLETPGPSHVQEPHQTSLLNSGDLKLEDTDVTFTTTPTAPQAATSQNSLVRWQRSSPDLSTFVQDMTDKHWNLLSANMRAKLTRDEFTAKCMDIVTWVKKIKSTVVVPALDLTMQIELTELPGSPGSGSEEAVTSLSRTVRLSCTQGPSRSTSSKTSWSTPTPFPSTHRSMTSLLSEEDDEDLIPGEFTYLSTPEGDNREVKGRPCSEPLSSVFGLSQSCVFNQMVHSGACRSLSEIVLPSSRSRQRKLMPIIVSTDTRLVMEIVEMVMKVINSRLAQLMLNVGCSQGTEGQGSNSASIQFAQEMLSMATASMYAHAMEHIALGRKSSSRQSNKSPLELERELEAILGPLAGQVIVTIINSILRTKDNGRTEQERTTPLSYFLTAVSAEIQSMVVQRSASRHSSRQSIRDHLMNVSKGKIVKAVQIKMSQLYGESTNESCISATPTIQSLSMCSSKESLCDWTLTSDDVHPAKFLSSNRITALSTDVVDVVFRDVLYNLGLSDSQTLLRPQCTGSSSSIDISGVAGEMVRQVSVKLQPFVSESSLEAMSMTHDSPSLPISDSDLKFLCSHSVVAVATACQAIKTELEIEMSLNPATEAGSQGNLAARDLVSSLSQSLEDIDVSHIIQGLKEADVTFANLNETLSTDTNRLEEILSAHISPESIAAASVDLFDGVLGDLHEAFEANKVSAATKSGRKKFWVEVHTSSQNLYTNALDKLNKWFSLHHLTEEKDVPLNTKPSPTGPLLTEACVKVSPVQKTSINSSSMSFRSLSNIPDNQLTLNTCTKEVIKQVASVLKVEASKEDCSSSVGGRTLNVFLEFSQKLDALISKLEDLPIAGEISSLTQPQSAVSSSRNSNISIGSILSVEFHTKANQIVSEAILGAAIVFIARKANHLELKMPATYSQHLFAAASDIVNIIVEDLERETMDTESHLTPKIVFDKFLDVAHIYYRVRDRLKVFFSLSPVPASKTKDVVDSMPVEKHGYFEASDTAHDPERPQSVRSEKLLTKDRSATIERSKSLASRGGTSTENQHFDTFTLTPTKSMSVLSDHSLRGAFPLLSESCQPLLTLKDSTVAVTKHSFTKSAKNTLSQILNVIKCRVVASDNSSVGQKTTDMLDSLLESLDQLTADEIKGTSSHNLNTIDMPESLPEQSLTKYLSTPERNQDSSPAKLVCQPSCLIPTSMSDTNILVKTIMETLVTDESKQTSAEENLERLVSIETIQGVSDDLITKVHGLIQEIAISRQLQSMAGHRSFSEPALPKPALKKLSRNDASELAYSFAENSVRTLLGQCLNVSLVSTGVRQTMDQVTKIMTNTVMDTLTDVSKPTVKSEDELVSRLVPPDEFPTRSLNPADGNAEVTPCASGGEKNSKRWRFLFKLPNIPKIRIKLFKRKGQAKKHPELEALPTKRFSDVSLKVPSTSPPMEDLIPAPTAQDPQSRKCPFVVRVFRALSRAITSPFRGASGKKH
ncbi:uncharacterized protein LOC118365429 [Oncorhynchus keta]|uniref:uncharacterized protein LOC118365429 n=1 Tax=Oncorhynchus keta TaxID=8018 RepID=UPI0015F92D57|nr:uncharacterized protein LOC118365429 [Oncorhynchus keta]XP_035603510.1 uncharacterized protein LOC118365429 [Oncorhynchus keta]